jgi:hypothetical protein
VSAFLIINGPADLFCCTREIKYGRTQFHALSYCPDETGTPVMKRDVILPLAGLVLGAALLALQFGLTIPARMATGASLSASIVFFLSFFTVLSNIGVVLTYLAALTRLNWLSWFRLHQTRTLFAVLILIVMLVYHFVLSGIWAPIGLFKLADMGLHYAAPVLYLVWWITLRRNERLTYGQIGAMMVLPLAYIVYVLVRGQMTGLYPYPFIDAGVLGYAKTLVNAAGLFALTAAIMVLFTGIDRQLLKISQK